MALEVTQTTNGQTPQNGSQSSGLLISRIDSLDALEPHLPSLRKLLQRCVNDDASSSSSSIGFLAPLADAAAVRYWLDLIPSSAVLLVATHPDVPGILATVQLLPCTTSQSHSHRGQVHTLLVHPTYRRHGFGRLMMAEVERLAREDLGLQLLTLDAARESPARDFFLREGWTEFGVCAGYARAADGRKLASSFFAKRIEAVEVEEGGKEEEEGDTMDP